MRIGDEGDQRPIEVWGGIECTVNRVGDHYLDQCRRSGHWDRSSDLELIAGLGIRKLRYPVLWEHVAPESPDRCDWRWSDERLARLRALGIAPIAGLLHHGSGPRYTALNAPDFAEKFAAYARRVAERYPWVEDYTPVNEILTTARFSGLYGHWYPHGQTGQSFARCLLNECRATVLAMRAIRSVNPRARLIQTDDLGYVHSTGTLAYQADFENQRRWLSFDLLTGQMTRMHPLWKYLAEACRVPEAELGWFEENFCPPDVLGLNYYITSERYLDHRTRHYPQQVIGSNGRHTYADVEAVRVLSEGIAGPEALLGQAWARYGLPIAITEVHICCTRCEQLRWMHELWTTAHNARAAGADLRAVTAWSLFGAYNWHSLLTRDEDYYEPGVFDLRSTPPRATALAGMVRALATTGHYDHPVLSNSGWWRRNCRLQYPPCPSAAWKRGPIRLRKKQPLLITGATGTLGRAFARLCELRGISHRLLRRAEFDIADPAQVRAVIGATQPWAVVNTAGYVRVDEAEQDELRCFRENAEGAQVLAGACAEAGIGFLSFSSDLVFDGQRSAPYVESSAVNPLNAYGRSKAAAELAVRDAYPGALMIRTSAFFGPWDVHNFVAALRSSARAGQEFPCAVDQCISPTYVPDLVDASLDLLIDGERGLWHLANAGALSWHAFAHLAAEALELEARIVPVKTSELGLAALRPAYSALDSERGRILPPLEDALARFSAAIEQAEAAPARAVS